jgi:hypothetical protein
MCIYYIIHNTLHHTPIMSVATVKNTNATRVRLGIRNDEKPVYTDSGWNKWWR